MPMFIAELPDDVPKNDKVGEKGRRHRKKIRPWKKIKLNLMLWQRRLPGQRRLPRQRR